MPHLFLFFLSFLSFFLFVFLFFLFCFGSSVVIIIHPALYYIHSHSIHDLHFVHIILLITLYHVNCRPTMGMETFIPGQSLVGRAHTKIAHC